MKSLVIEFFSLIGMLFYSCSGDDVPVMETGSAKPMPGEWIDADTDHRVKRLSDTGSISRSFYFHNNPFIPQMDNEGDLMVYYGNYPENPDDRLRRSFVGRQLFTVNLKTLEQKQITDHPGEISGEIVGMKSRKVFYQTGDSVFFAHIDSRATELIYVFPDSIRGTVTTLNADETLLGGVANGPEKTEILNRFPRKGDFFARIYEAKIPHSLITIDLRTGTLKKIFSDTAWLNHVQFSPADPNLLMFCHEGPWHLLDRIWTIDLRTGEARMMHERTMPMEIAGHEFFSRDGQTIWFDLQLPKGETFYLAGLELSTGKEKHYAMTRDEWSIHFNISPDQSLFAGDGGDPEQVARARDGRWIYLFTPQGDSLRSKRLVNMKHHDYDLEPNVHFSPDGKWIIFRANFEGASQIYAVEIQ
ncbi:MAG: hypothetical protein JXR52_11270 [Bacteroidales bacterium]|nr:hypothetical protein [Bacteroidales bacterium]